MYQIKNKKPKNQIHLSKTRNRTKSRDKTNSLSCNKSIKIKTKTQHNCSLFQSDKKQQAHLTIKTKPFIPFQKSSDIQNLQLSNNNKKKNKQTVTLQTEQDIGKITKRKKKKSENIHKKKTTKIERQMIQSTIDLKSNNIKKKKTVGNLRDDIQSKYRKNGSFLLNRQIEKKQKLVLNINKKNKKKSNDSKKSKLNIKTQPNSQFTMNSTLINRLTSVTSHSSLQIPNHIFTGRTIKKIQCNNITNITKIRKNQSILKDPNALLRLHIKKQNKKRLQAVIIIQKIWRGYLTRKLLKQYIFEEESKLQSMLKNIKLRLKTQISSQIKIEQDSNILSSIQNTNKKNKINEININQILQENGVSRYYQQFDGNQEVQFISPYQMKCKNKTFEQKQYLQQSQIFEQGRIQLYKSQSKNKSYNKNINEVCIRKQQKSSEIKQQVQISKPVEIRINEFNNEQQKNKGIEQTQSESTKSQYKQQMNRIKKRQIQRWENMINFLQNKTKKDISQNSLMFVKNILKKSKDNKDQLVQNKKDKYKLNLEGIKLSFQRQDNMKKRVQVINTICVNDNLQKSERINKLQIQQLLNKKYSQFNCKNIQHIIKYRQQLIKQKQIIQHQKLNALIKTKKIDPAQYYQKSSYIKYITNQQIKQIQHSKKYIQKGLKIAIQFIQKTQKQAQLLHKNIGFSKSTQTFKRNYRQIIQQQQLTPNPHLFLNYPSYKSQIFFQNSQPNSNNASNQSSLQSDRIIPENQEFDEYKNIEFNGMNTQRFEFVPENSVELNYETQKLQQFIEQKLIIEAVVEILINEKIFGYFQQRYNIGERDLEPIKFNERYRFFQMLNEQLTPLENQLLKQQQKLKDRSVKLLKEYRVDQEQEDQYNNYYNVRQYIKKNDFSQSLQNYKKQMKQIKKVQNNKITQKKYPQDFAQLIQKYQLNKQKRRKQYSIIRQKFLINQFQIVTTAWNQTLNKILKITTHHNHSFKLSEFLLISKRTHQSLCYEMIKKYQQYNEDIIILISEIQQHKDWLKMDENWEEQQLKCGLMLRIGLEIDFIVNQILITQFCIELMEIKKCQI